MAESASGSGTATISDLTVRNLDTAALPSILAAADGLTGEITPQAIERAASSAVFSGQSVLGTVKVPFSIAGGTVRAQNVSAGDGTAALSGDAELTFPENRLNATLRLNYRPGEGSACGRRSASQPWLCGDTGAARGDARRHRSGEFPVTSGPSSANAGGWKRCRPMCWKSSACAGKWRFTRPMRPTARRSVLRAEEEERRRKAAAEEAARLKQEAEARALAERQAAEKLAAEKQAAEEAARAAGGAGSRGQGCCRQGCGG